MDSQEAKEICRQLGSDIIDKLTDEDISVLGQEATVVRRHADALRRQVGSTVDLSGMVPPTPSGPGR